MTSSSRHPRPKAFPRASIFKSNGRSRLRRPIRCSAMSRNSSAAQFFTSTGRTCASSLQSQRSEPQLRSRDPTRTYSGGPASLGRRKSSSSGSLAPRSRATTCGNSSRRFASTCRIAERQATTIRSGSFSVDSTFYSSTSPHPARCLWSWRWNGVVTFSTPTRPLGPRRYGIRFLFGLCKPLPLEASATEIS
jgi:hypothetical protein